MRRVNYGENWSPREGGVFKASGNRFEQRVAKSEEIQKRVGTDRRRRNRWEKIETPVYVEGQRYTRKELEYMADEILRRSLTHPGAHRADPMILFPEHLKERRKREIYVESGIPDPSFMQGIYNRTHPQGRKVIPEEQRKKHGASFYR